MGVVLNRASNAEQQEHRHQHPRRRESHLWCIREMSSLHFWRIDPVVRLSLPLTCGALSRDAHTVLRYRCFKRHDHVFVCGVNPLPLRNSDIIIDGFLPCQHVCVWVAVTHPKWH
ncbi:hypothetical protein CEXT_219391 [Caerostris extrusa]|uniref:Uncharacterized protein n=1 Tax=Caerostris extrusa TaxID=172846 RepID=A0AAV4WN42_CAEEX|nr:hypothetical protein CEXT_219391 [Caerostris extrusa]